MTGKKVAQFAAEMADREAIRDCLYRYCRAVDRCDADLALSTFWEDATDDHGIFKGSAVEFVNWALKALSPMHQTQHMLANILINIDGGSAHVESYIRAYHRLPRANGKPYDLISSGRYLDRFERRDDEWRVLHRQMIRDWFREYPDSADWEKGLWGQHPQFGSRKPTDPSYSVLKL